MKIKIDDRFTLSQSLHSNGFDLIEKVIRTNQKTEQKYESEVTLCYDMSMENSIQTIISERLKKKQETVELSEFLDNYKKEKEELLSKIKL